MKTPKNPSELTTADINHIHSIYMQSFVTDRVRTSDRDDSQKNNIRIWYKAICSFLVKEDVLVNCSHDPNDTK